jgi:hypothetical protein
MSAPPDTREQAQPLTVHVKCVVDSTRAPRPGFYIGHESWYWPTPTSEGLRARITVGLYYDDVGCDFEFSFRWRERLDFATLELHDDGWSALTDPRFVAMFATMATLPRPVEPDHVVSMLTALGFADLTSREEGS